MALGLAQAQSLAPCTAASFAAQMQQSNCLVANPNAQTVITFSYTNEPTFSNTQLNVTVSQYRTTLTALLNGGTTVFQQTFSAPFSDPSVQNAISQADALLASDGATFSSPALTATSTALQSSALAYVPAGPAPALSTLIGCGIALGATEACSGVVVTNNSSSKDTFGPATVMIGPTYSDQFVVPTGQLNINTNQNFTYVVDQDAITTNTYVTAQTYVIQGKGGSAPLSLCGIALNGKTKVSVVQSVINGALGLTSPVDDLNGDGVVNIVDVQIVMEAALGSSCAVVTPAISSGTLAAGGQSQSTTVRQEPANGTISTVAGNGSPGYSGDGGAATSAEIMNPAGVAVDSAGNLYIADASNYRIRKVAANGVISTVAGNGNPGYSGDGGPATSATMMHPAAVAVDVAGNLYIADSGNSSIRKVAVSDTISTVAGGGIAGYSGGSSGGYSGDGGPATDASLDYPSGVATDLAGNLYIADTYNQRIRKVAVDGTISLVAGNGNAGYSGDGAAASNATLYYPAGVTVDSAGALYIADSANHRVRKVAASGVISTVAGNGSPGYSGDGGPATMAMLMHPAGVAVDAAGNLYIADSSNNRVREVAADGTISTVAGDGARNVSLYDPSSVALDPAGNLFIADAYNQLIRVLMGHSR